MERRQDVATISGKAPVLQDGVECACGNDRSVLHRGAQTFACRAPLHCRVQLMAVRHREIGSPGANRSFPSWAKHKQTCSQIEKTMEPGNSRSEEHSVGKECVSTGRSRWTR